jgi:hypothetical protein
MISQKEISRYYPSKKEYPIRYNNNTFDKFNEMNNPKIHDNYNKWKEGINPHSNRKIKIGGKTHENLKNEFLISFLHSYSNGGSTWRSTLFLNLINIDQKEYINKTTELNNEIDKENILISTIIEKINSLKSWNDFIEFDGKKYGLTKKVLNNIHLENDCFGKMEYYKKKERECRGCRDGMLFNGPYTCGCYEYNMNKCNKCNYEEKEQNCI